MTTLATPDPARRLLDQLRDAALLYASRGWHVFPLIPGTKKPACPGHPAARCDRSDPWCRRGHKGWEDRATTSDARILRAWSSRPYGIGLACGPSSLLVVDSDQPKPDGQDGAGASTSGEDTLAELQRRHGRLSATYTVATPSGGLHRYYVRPDGLQLGNTAGQLGPLVDWLAQLLTTPQRPVNAAQWAAGRSPTHGPAPTPMGLAGPPARYVIAAVNNESARVRAALPGTRNPTLFTAAVALGQLVGGQVLDEHTARDRLREACAQHVLDGAFTAVEADATITSGLTRGAAEPRTGRTPTR